MHNPELDRASFTPSQSLRVIYNWSVFDYENVLSHTFPTIWKFIGEKCAETVTQHFAESHSLLASRHMEDWRASFPRFLSNFESTKHMIYLEDVALFEWAEHLSCCAEDASCLDLKRMQAIAAQDASEIVFQCHPSLHLVSSIYPLKRIIEDSDTQGTRPIKLEEGPSFALIVRPYKTVHIHWVTEDLFAFFSALKEGDTLGRAHQRAQQLTPDFDAQEALLFAFRNDLFRDVNATPLRRV